MADQKGIRVLVVEDDALIALDLAETLQEHGFEVMGPCPSVKSALALLAAATPDCALLDLNLRDEWSFPIADCLAERRIPFVIVTGHESYMLPEQHQDRPLLLKPYDERSLLNALRAAWDTDTRRNAQRG